MQGLYIVALCDSKPFFGQSGGRRTGNLHGGGGLRYNRRMKTLIIAEIGTSHSGSKDKACQLIDAAAQAGADCVKFQWVYADEILHPDTGAVDLPSGKMPLYDTFKVLECPPSFYRQCMEYAHQKGLLFACSPFGSRSFDALAALCPDAIKIASPELNHFALLQKCAALHGKIPLILSSGVSKLADIEAALEVIGASGATETNATCVTERSNDEGDESAPESPALPPLTLLHCVTSYPAPEEQSNVACVETLRGVFGVSTGMSDHSLSPTLVPTLAAMKRAAVIEKHITLNHEDGGLDDSVALEPEHFALMVHVVHQTCAMMENFDDDERSLRVGFKRIAEKRVMQQLEDYFPRELIRAALGDGVKRLAPVERANWGKTNRSLHYMRAMKRGERVTAGDIAALRSEKNLSAGVSPRFEGTLLGAVLTRDVSAGAGVQLEDFLQKG